MDVCKKHQEFPAKGYSQCVGCEVERLQRELRESEEISCKHREHVQAIAEMVGEGDDIGAAWEGVNALRESLSASQAREQALAAHVERISRKIDDAPPIDNPTIAKWECELTRIIEDPPATSLARLKAQWQAEALHVVADRIAEHGAYDREFKNHFVGICRMAAEEIEGGALDRRQSKEPTQ